jgi:predicted MPP superfamily phosphohydrolase
MFWLASLLTLVALLAVLYHWATRSFPALARRRRAVALTLAGLVLAQLATRWMVIVWHVGSPLQTAFIVLMMTLAIASVPIGVMHALAWIAESGFRLRASGSGKKSDSADRKSESPDRSPEPGARSLGTMTRRQVVEATGGVAFLGATGSMLGWGMVRGRHEFELVELPVRIAALPRALDGYVIVQISDLHTGTYVGERELDEGLERVRRAKPDLVVVTGDLVDFDPRYAPLVARKLGTLTPRDGVFAALGNHDYYTGTRDVLGAVRAAGITPLVDDGRVIRAGDGGGFALLGVDDLWSARYGRSGPRLDHALAAVPEALPRILLSHQPHTMDLWAGKVALQLSGHTHGGQINPGFRPADLFMHYVAGEYRVRGSVLYVNRGFGTVGPPSRVGAAPEVTRIVLVAA